GSVRWNKRGGLRTYTQLNDSSTPAGVLTSSSRRISAGHDPETDYDERLGFLRTLARRGEEIEISVHRFSSPQREHYDYTNHSFIPAAASSYNNLTLRENHATTEFGVDYVLPF